MKKATRRLDSLAHGVIMQIPSWLRPILILITTFGLPIFTVGTSLLIILAGIDSKNDLLVDAGLITILALIITGLLKFMLRRKRPSNDYVEKMIFDTFSFPSGHATGSLASYGLLGGLLVSMNDLVSTLIAIFLFLLIPTIGISRVYLGAHYASDVIGGWIIGGIGLIAIAVIYGLV